MARDSAWNVVVDPLTGALVTAWSEVIAPPLVLAMEPELPPKPRPFAWAKAVPAPPALMVELAMALAVP